MKTFCNSISAKGRAWELRAEPAAAQEEFRFRDGTIVPREVVEIVARRGVTDIAGFFEPNLRTAMPDPSNLLGMDDANARFCKAIRAGGKIPIFGDYAVDGP